MSGNSPGRVCGSSSSWFLGSARDTGGVASCCVRPVWFLLAGSGMLYNCLKFGTFCLKMSASSE